MSSHILQALPDIHGILMGVSIAFYSAFAIYAYQKLDANNEEINKLVADARRLCTPVLIVTDSKKFLLDNALDWNNKAEPFLKELRVICKKTENRIFPDDCECAETIFKLCETFYWLYVTYPFFGEHIDCDDNNRQEIERKTRLGISPQRISELEERLMTVNWIKLHSYDEIMSLVKKADYLEKKGIHLQGEPSGNIDENDIKMISYKDLVRQHFDIAKELELKILPSLKHAVLSRDYFLRKLDLKTLSRNSRAIFFYILSAGIILPLTLTEAGNSITIHEKTPYLLLLLTITPYFIIVDIIYQKIKSLKL